MRRFLSNLVRNFRTVKSARPAHRLPRRTMLQLEILEDRLVPTNVSLSGSTLTVNNVAQNHTIGFQGYGNDGMQVLDNNQVVYTNTNKQSINKVNVQISNDGVGVSDSNGMPFAYGTTVNLSSSTPAELWLGGSRAVSGNEVYVAGGAPWTSGMIQLDHSTFNLAPSIADVSDAIQITGTFDVQTSGLGVGNWGGKIALLSGLGSGGGGTLAYEAKPYVVLEEYSSNASVYTTSSNAAEEYLGKSFTVNLHGTGDSVTINGTPSNVTTSVNTTIAPVANQADVYLLASTGSVTVNGNSSTYLGLGWVPGHEAFSTQGIQGAVVVNGVGDLSLLDNYNTAQENVVVTPGTISGSGLFGNSNVTVRYNLAPGGSVYIETGTAKDAYMIETTSAYPKFSNSITIDDNSTTGFVAKVAVDLISNLNLHLYNENVTLQNEAELLFLPESDEYISFSGNINGTAYVEDDFGDITGSASYQGFGVTSVI